MAALVFGAFSLLTFFVPLLCPLLALCAAGYGLLDVRRRRRLRLATAGMVCAAVAIGLHVWIWRFGHLP